MHFLEHFFPKSIHIPTLIWKFNAFNNENEMAQPATLEFNLSYKDDAIVMQHHHTRLYLRLGTNKLKQKWLW